MRSTPARRRSTSISPAAGSSGFASPTTAPASSATSCSSRSRGTRRRSSRRVDDLAAIATLGFRGEALASIAAVSRLALASRAAGRPHAWRIEVDGGTVGATAPAALADGTTVTVEELYFNTPARRKFLRTEATEWGHCEEAFRRIALAHPDVGFTLQHNGRVVHRLLAHGRRARVEALLGDAFVDGAAAVDVEAGPLALTGFAVRPRTRRRSPASTRSSTAASCAIACSRMRCARRIATCCITTASRRTRCG